MEKRTSEVQSLSRAIAVLRAFTREEPELGVTEIGRRVGLHKSTAFRLLSTLIAEGLVAQDPETERYRLSVGLLDLAGRVQMYADVRQVARQYMQSLAQNLSATVNLAVLDGGTSFNLEQSVPRGFLVNNYGWVGRRTPLHATSTGKVLLAWLTPAELDSILDQPLQGFTPHTITDPEVLQRELESIRQAGYAIGHEEYEIGLNAIAVPLHNRASQVVAALSISGPAYRLSPESFEEAAEAVMACGHDISAQMGHLSSSERVSK